VWQHHNFFLTAEEEFMKQKSQQTT